MTSPLEKLVEHVVVQARITYPDVDQEALKQILKEELEAAVAKEGSNDRRAERVLARLRERVPAELRGKDEG